MAGGKNSAHKILLRERRATVIDLRKRGKSYRAIADDIRVDPRFSHLQYTEKSARDDCSVVLRSLAEDTRNDANELRQLELEKLDLAMSSIVNNVETGDYGAIDRWIKGIELRAKILGLHVDPGGLNKAFSILKAYGYEIRDRQGGGYEIVDSYTPATEE
jgi:hypothetical protein